jgi:Membrane-associated phospholipid phosphatase
MRNWLILLCLFPLGLGAQSLAKPGLAGQLWQDTRGTLIYALQSPGRATASDWVGFGLGSAALALAFSQDGDWQAKIASHDRLGKGFVATYLAEPFGNDLYTMPLSLGIYLLGNYIGAEPLTEIAGTAFQALLLSGGATLVFKLAFHRERPAEQAESDPYAFGRPSLRRKHLSFPSGHTAGAFSLATAITLATEGKWYVALPLYGLASLSAWQRISENRHWPSDVVAGAMIGVWAGFQAHGWRQNKKSSRLGFFIGGQGPGLQWQLDQP